MNINTSMRALTLASMLAFSVISPLAVHVHAEANDGAGSGSSSSTQCETTSGMFDPATGSAYKAGTKVDVNTKVGDTSDHKVWTCNADGSWHEARTIQTGRFLPIMPSVGAILPR